MNFERIMERNLPENYVLDISPTEFEVLVKDFLSAAGKGLPSFEVVHNVNERATDGTYQIDVKATFEIFGGGSIVVLVECKKYSSSIKREKVQILHSRLQSLGAHKGMIFSTSAFQQGAIEFAAKHGIALVRLVEGKFTFETRSLERVPFETGYWFDIPKYVGIYIHNVEETKCSISNIDVKNVSSLNDFIYS